MKVLSKPNALSLAIGLALGGVLTLPDVAQAQEGKSARVQIEEVIVTAEKRAQSLQEVPVAISAFTSDMLEAQGIDTPQDLQLSVPGLSMVESDRGGVVKVTMRGIGTENLTPGGDPGVPIHINGHYIQSPAYILRDFMDVERVEVQRGPQGTLYGRNAIGGNINIITKKPTDTFEGMISGEVGDYDKRKIQVMISGPISENLRGRIALSDESRDGYVKNVGIGGKDMDTSDYTAVRGALEYDITDDLQLNLNAYYFHDKGNNFPRYIGNYPQTPTFLGGPNYWILNNAGTNITNSDPFKVRANTPSEQTDESKGISIDFNWSLGGVEFRSLSAYDDTFKERTSDNDGSDKVFTEVRYPIGYETFSQELQLLSTNSSSLQWVAGLFYYREDSGMKFESLRGSTLDLNGDGDINSDDPRRLVVLPVDIDSTSVGIYGQLEYQLTDQLTLISGLRYSKDEKARVDGIGIGFEGGPYPNASILPHDDEDQWSEVTGKLGLNYYLNSDAMLYASYSNGYKAGGFNATQADSYDPETVDAFEVGLKSQWMDNRIQTNISTFYYDYKDKQDIQSIPTPAFSLFALQNASSATIFGVELEAQAYLTSAFLLDFSLGFLNAEFDQYNTIDGMFPALGSQDLSGNKLPFSPEWKVNMGAQYEWTLSDDWGIVNIRTDVSWVDDQWTNGFNREGDGGLLVGDGDLLSSYHIVNARLQWESSDEAWLTELYVKNLTDEVVQTYSFFVDGAQFATFLPPRTYGVKLTFNF